MKTNTVRGTRDFLPQEERVRDYIKNSILETYQSFGFEKISTPILEDLANLEKSDGGENLGLIFKILKRGDKLRKEIEKNSYDQLCDVGLRYDLTLPLSRYYAGNREVLPTPFKCIQIDRVYRAERPQKGRLREFYQCDIDIIGEESISAEIELITVTAKALQNIGLKDFTIKVNDRRLLSQLLLKIGFRKDQIGSVSIIFDKLDKIKISGVREELIDSGFDTEVVDKFMEFLSLKEVSLDNMAAYCKDKELTGNLKRVIDCVTDLSKGSYEVIYDKF
jgi:histidyl-tRNA synthetase